MAASGSSTGVVDAHVAVPGGWTFNSVTFDLSNATTQMTGDLRVEGSPSISFPIANVTPGAGYTLQVSLTATDGPVTCTGASTPFPVFADQTAQTTVSLVCTTTGPLGTNPPDTSHCPTWDTLVANPLVVPVAGGTSMLAATASSPDGASTFAWSASTGTIHDVHQTPTRSTAVFTCPEARTSAVITLVVGDPLYPDAGACPVALTTGTLAVDCPAPGVDAGAD
jgi:hypothetical protein